MKDPERAIDQLLAGLRDIEAPAGMTRQILDAAKRSSLAKKPANRRLPFLSVRRNWMWASALGGVIAAVVIIEVLFTGSPFTPQRSEKVGSLVLPSFRPANSGVNDVLGARRETPPRAAMRKARRGRDLDSISLGEARSPSHPASPATLTHQEEMLVGVVSGGGPVPLALLRAGAEEAEAPPSLGHLPITTTTTSNQP